MQMRGLITDDNHPQMHAARQDLARALVHGLVARSKLLDGPCIDDAYSIIDDHRVSWLLRGVQFPRMRVLAFPRIGQMEVVRADLTRQGIQTTLVNMTVKHPDLTAEEIAVACAHAFPDYRPDPIQRRTPKIIQPGDVQWGG